MKKNKAPVIISISFLIIDQISKFLILKYIPFGEKKPFIQGLLLSPEYNTGIIYHNNIITVIITILLPILALFLLTISLLSFDKYLKIQRLTMWIISGAVISNIIDRVFRNGRVLEFIHINIMTFSHVYNIAEISVAICGIIMLLSLIINDRSLL